LLSRAAPRIYSIEQKLMEQLTMKAPADRTAKRLSIEEWFARYDSLDLFKRQQAEERVAKAMFAPADRIAVRA
jgi:hypothetical protein